MFERIRSFFGPTPVPAPTVEPLRREARPPRQSQQRSFQAGVVDRINAFWSQQSVSSNAELYLYLPVLRHRSRELFRNNDYMRKYTRLIRHNVAGPKGIQLQNKALDANGSPDRYANAAIEAAWATFTRKENFDTAGALSYAAACKLIPVTKGIDGEAFTRTVKNFSPSKARIAVQFIESERVPVSLNDPAQGISMGIKYDGYGRPLGYYVVKPQRNVLLQQNTTAVSASDCDYYPASEIQHHFTVEFPGQQRGIPSAHTALLRLGQLTEYEKAELMAAWLGASQAGFFEKEDVDALAPGEDDTDDEYGDGGFTVEIKPGTWTALPPGVKPTPYSPNHPNGNVGPFVKAQLQGAASGLGVAYTSLSSDMQGVSYSTARTAMLDERDMWRDMQQELIEGFCVPVYEAFLESVLFHDLAGGLPLSKKDKFNAPVWRPRGFAWIDPQVETDANVTSVKAGFKSLSDVLAESGRDFEETVTQIAAEQKRIKELGLSLPELQAAIAKPVATQDQQPKLADDETEKSTADA